MLGLVLISCSDNNSQQSEAASDLNAELVKKGKIYYRQIGCATCHSIDGTKRAAPTFKGLYGSEETLSDGSKIRVNEEYVIESITNPRAKIVKGFQPMHPPYTSGLKDEQLSALLAFIKSLE